MLNVDVCCSSDQDIHVSAAVTLDNQVSGIYKKIDRIEGGKPVYAREDGKYCFGFHNNWKLEACDHASGFATVGFIRAPPEFKDECPIQVGNKWMYYGSDAPNLDISIACKGTVSNAHYLLYSIICRKLLSYYQTIR